MLVAVTIRKRGSAIVHPPRSTPLAVSLRIRSTSSPAVPSRLRPLHSYSMSNQSGRDITRQICEVWRENDGGRETDRGGASEREKERVREEAREQAAPTPNSRYVIKSQRRRSLSSDKVVAKCSNISPPPGPMFK